MFLNTNGRHCEIQFSYISVFKSFLKYIAKKKKKRNGITLLEREQTIHVLSEMINKIQISPTKKEKNPSSPPPLQVGKPTLAQTKEWACPAHLQAI